VSTPRPTSRGPHPHVTLIETVRMPCGQRAENREPGSFPESGRSQVFGLTEVHGPDDARDYALVLGCAQSRQVVPGGLVAGASVFVCDNLSFSGEVRLTRKHTVHLQRDLPRWWSGVAS